MRLLGAIAALTLLLPVTGAEAARSSSRLSARLQQVTEPGGASGTQAAQSRRLGLPGSGGGSLSRLGATYVTEIRTAGTGTALLDRLERAGARILHVSDRYDTVTAALARDELAATAGVRGVRSVQEVLRPELGRAGAGTGTSARRASCPSGVVSEGDDQLRAVLARATYGIDGAGVKVGVLSDSYATSATASTGPGDDVASGDLPGPGNPCGHTLPVQVVEDAPDAESDEGRAMLQIVHDLAPGAELSFATALISETAFADNIIALKDAGARVIVDDIIYLGEPFYQDGPIANAVKTVTDAGVAYFSMAFNNGQVVAGKDVGSYEALAYRPTTCPAAITAALDCMDFDPGAGADNQLSIGVSVDDPLKTVLQWAEPRGGVETDLDLYLLNGGAISRSSVNDNLDTQRPFEYAGFDTAAATGTREVVIARFAGDATPRVKFVVSNNGSQINSFEYPTGGGVDTVGPTIFGHNGAAAAQTVGAIPFDGTDAPEDYSGRGPVTLLFEPVPSTAALGAPAVRSKPDVTATDGGITTFFGPGNRFFGTSAAAPHAAAVAALQLQEAPGLSPAALKQEQQDTATAIGAFGPSAIGAGLLDAVGAIGADALDVTATGPAPLVNDRRAPTSFAANHRSTTFTCAVDGGAAAPCASPFLPPVALGDGAHTVTVAGRDAGAHTDSATVAFGVDGTAPDTQITAGPAASGTATTATFTFRATDADVKGFECRLDAAAFAPCAATGQAYAGLALGAHQFAVRAIDNLDNADATPAIAGWQVTAPVKKARCKVPKLKGKTRKAAKKALKKAHCKLGKVRGPKRGRVKSQSVKAGKSKPSGTKVAIRLKRKRKR